MTHLHPWASLWGYCSCKSCYMIQRRVPAIPMPGTPGPSIAVEASRWHLFIWDTHDGPSWPTLWHSLLYWLSLTHGNFLTEVFAQQQPPQLAAPTLPHLLGSSFFTLGNAACLAHKRTAPHHPKKKKKNPNQPHKSSTSTLDKNVGELPAQVIARLCPHMTRKSFRCTFLEESQLSLKRPPMDHPVHVPCPQLPGWETPGLAAPFSQGWDKNDKDLQPHWAERGTACMPGSQLTAQLSHRGRIKL